MKKQIVLGITGSLIATLVTALPACSSSSGGPAGGAGGGSSKDGGSGGAGGSSAGGTTSSGGASASAGGSSAGGSSSGGTGAGGASAGSGAGCLQKVTLVTPAVNAACEELASSADYAQGETTCNGLHATGVAYSWVTSCPAGKIGGCKVPAGAVGGATGGSTRWSYSGKITCAAGETEVDASGTPVAKPDAGAVAPWDGTFGPGGPLSASCSTFITQTLFTGNRGLKCFGMCPSCNNGAGAPNDQVCLDCIQKDYGAAACSTDAAFEDLFKFACNETTIGIAKACAKECGH